jgi:hypothetical protein
MCLITLLNWLVIRTMDDAMEDGGRNIFLVLHLHLTETSDLI